jgi:hypothetical protein
VELLRVVDGVQGVTVRLVVSPVWEDAGVRVFSGVVAVRSDWINAETDTAVDVCDGDRDGLDWWETVLDRFAAWGAAGGEDRVEFDWPPMGRSGYLRVSGEDGAVSVRVCDGPRTSIGVHVPVDVPGDWIDVNRALLAAARAALGRG